MKLPLLICVLGPVLIVAQKFEISGERMRPHVRFLASDLLEGRGVGTRGGDLATEYIAAQFELEGLKPAGDKGTYFERVPLVGAETAPDAKVAVTRGGQTADLRWLDDYV